MVNSASAVIESPVQTMRLLAVSREMSGMRPLWSIADSNSWKLETAASAWEALERVQSGLTPHLLILDLPRGDGDGLHILRWLHRLRPELPTVVLCHTADADKKQDAIRMGANEVLVRPFGDEELEIAIYRYLRRDAEAPAYELSGGNIDSLAGGKFFLSASAAMQKLRVQAELLAQTDVPVLIVGEKGSGKKTVARLIHKLSVRSGFRFSTLRCGDVPSDLLEQSFLSNEAACDLLASAAGGEKGTILFDELMEMPHTLQARLTSVLREGPHARNGAHSHLRILASTSENPEKAISEKRLREDLYYKLSAFTVHVPPLRQRKEEIVLLLKHFMHSMAKHYGLPPREFPRQVIESCESYSWPGNIAELETFVKRYLVAGNSGLVLSHLESHGNSASQSRNTSHAANAHEQSTDGDAPAKSLKSLIQDIKCETERNAIGLALEKTGWNRKAAARLLKVSYRTLLYKIEHYHMKASEPFLSPLAIHEGGNGKAV